MLDAIASVLCLDPFVGKPFQEGELVVFKLTAELDGPAQLNAMVEGATAYTQDFDLTTFPLAEITIYVQSDGIHWTVFLPSEY